MRMFVEFEVCVCACVFSVVPLCVVHVFDFEYARRVM